MNKIFFIILIIFLPIFILLQIINTSVFNIKFYDKKYKEYGIEKITGKNSEELIVVTEDLLNYLKEEELELEYKELYSNRDIIHLVDVKYLFQKGFIIRKLSFILSVFSIIFLYFKDKRYLYKSTFYSSIISIILMLLIFVFSYIDFDKLFTYFHLALFDNDYWILDPEKDFLIKLFPEGFFIDIFGKITLLFIGVMAIILIISYLLKERKKDGEYI